MIRALSGFEVMPMQNFSASGAKDSKTVFNTLLGQIGKGNAGQLSQQTLQEIFEDVAEGRLSADQAIQLIEAGAKNSPQGVLSLPGGDGDLSTQLHQGIFKGVAAADQALEVIYAADQNNQQAIVSLAGGDNLTERLLEEVADRNLNGQPAANMIATLPQNGGAPASYGIGDSRSGQFLLALLHEVAVGKIGADQAVQLVDAVQPVDQTPE